MINTKFKGHEMYFAAPRYEWFAIYPIYLRANYFLK